MENKLPCDRHDEQLKTLFQNHKETVIRVEKIEEKVDNMFDIKIAINTLSLSMEHIIKHNEKQDSLYAKQSETLENMNENLNELNESQKNLNQVYEMLGNRVTTVEGKLKDSDEKQNINVLDLLRDFIVKIAIPVGVVGAIIGAIIKFL